MNDNQNAIGTAEMWLIPASDDPKIIPMPQKIGSAACGTIPPGYIGRAAFSFQIKAGGRDQSASALDIGKATLPETHIWQIWANHLRRHLGVEAVGVKDFGQGFAALTFIACSLLAYHAPKGKFIALSLEFVPDGPVQTREHFVDAKSDYLAAHAQLHAELTRPDYGPKRRENTCNETPQDMLYIMEGLGTFANYVLPNRQGASLLARHIEGFLNSARVAEGLTRLKI